MTSRLTARAAEMRAENTRVFRSSMNCRYSSDAMETSCDFFISLVPPAFSPPPSPVSRTRRAIPWRVWAAVAVEVFVGQDFVSEMRVVFPADDGLGDFAFQERRDLLAVRDVFVVLHVVAVRPFDGEDLGPISKCRFEFLPGAVFRPEDELHGLLFVVRLHAHAEGKVAVVECLLLGEVGGGERFLVRLG